jgi:hypothetical protein
MYYENKNYGSFATIVAFLFNSGFGELLSMPLVSQTALLCG